MQFLQQVKLPPVKTKIDGIEGEIDIYQFTLDEWEKTVGPAIEGQDLQVAVLYFVNSAGYKHTEQDVEQITSRLGVNQIKDIYLEGLRVNGCAPKSGDNAKKN